MLLKTMDTATQISGWALLKNTSYALAFVGTSHYLNISAQSAAVLGGLICTDVFTGVLKSGTIRGWRSIRSSILERGLIAKALIIVAPVTVALAGKGIGVDLSSLAQSIITVLILSEAYSVIGNIYAIRTGKITTEFDAIAYILASIRNLLKKVIIEDAPTDPFV